MLKATVPLKDQLPNTVIWQDELARFDKVREAICSLYMWEYISENQKEQMMHRLEKDIIADEKERMSE